MIDWSDEQRAQIWKLYTQEQLTMDQIAQRYGHLGATRSAISGVITRINKERDEQVEKDIEMAKRRDYSYGVRPEYLNERKARNLKKPRKNPPLTKEEIEKLKDIRP